MDNLELNLLEELENTSATKLDLLKEEEKWRKRTQYYYRDIENYCLFWISPKASVLEVGSGLGHLLQAVKPVHGLGIDTNELLVEEARSKNPILDFKVGNAEEIAISEEFDFVIMANTLSYINNIQKALINISKVCRPHTRLVLTFHNPLWEPILKFATSIKQRRPLPPLNWLSYEDVENLLHLSGFEVIHHSNRMLIPKKIPVLSNFINRFLAPLPGLNKLCLTEGILARLVPSRNDNKALISSKTCSIIIPARNEAGNIEQCITRMPRMGAHTEIIFIEGHSRDNTWDEIKRVQTKYCKEWDIKIAQQKGKGKGDAVRQGFQMAQGDVLIILDSDLTVAPEDLVYFFEAIATGTCEFANGCRLVYPVDSKAMPFLNKMANRFFAWILSYLLNTKIKDSLCGTKAISKENYLKIAANRSYFGDFDPFGDFDLLFGSSKLGLLINDIPVRYVPRIYGSSNIQHFKEGLTLLKMCIYAAKKLRFIPSS
jgi:SAM-dependent methyltransferase